MRWRSIICMLLCTLFLLSSSQAQTGGWQAVEAITPGSDISVKDQHRSVKCTLERVTASTLFCVLARHHYIPVYVEFDRQSVRQVRLEHPGRGAALGAVVGIGLGAATGVALSKGNNDAETRVYTPIELAILGGIVTGIILGKMQIPHGKVVYRR